MYSTVKIIWFEFLLLKTFPEWLWRLSSLSEVADRQGNSNFEERSAFKIGPPSPQGSILNRDAHCLLQGQTKCWRLSGPCPGLTQIWEWCLNKSLMKPGFAMTCFFVLKTRTRKKPNLEHFLTTGSLLLTLLPLLGWIIWKCQYLAIFDLEKQQFHTVQSNLTNRQR